MSKLTHFDETGRPVMCNMIDLMPRFGEI